MSRLWIWAIITLYFIILSTCTFNLRLDLQSLSANNLTNINPCIFTVLAHWNDHLVRISFRTSFHITFTFRTVLTTLLHEKSASGWKCKMSLPKSNFLMIFGTFWLHLKPPISYCNRNVRYFCLTFNIQVSFYVEVVHFVFVHLTQAVKSGAAKRAENWEVKGSWFLDFLSVYEPMRCACFLLLDAPVSRAGWFGGGDVKRRGRAQDNPDP